MDDDIVDGGGEPDAGGAGGNGGAGDGGADLTIGDIIADVEAGLLEGGDGSGHSDQASDDDGGDPKSATPAASALPPGLKTFIDQNYGGDVDKFMAAQYESRAESQRMKERLEALEAEKTTTPTRDTAAELKARQEQDEEVRGISTQISALDASITSLTNANTSILQRAGTLDGEIKTLEQQMLSSTDDQARLNLSLELRDKKADMRDLTAEYRSNEIAKRGDTQTKALLNRDLNRVKQDVAHRMQQEEEEERSQADNNAQSLAFYNRAFEEEIAKFALDPKDPGQAKTLRYIYLSTKGILSDWLQGQGYNAKPLDYHGFKTAVSNLLGKAEEGGAIKRKVGGGPGNRPANRSRNAAPPTPQNQRRINGPGGIPRKGAYTPKTADDIFDDPNLIRQRAQAIQDRLERESAARGGR